MWRAGTGEHWSSLSQLVSDSRPVKMYSTAAPHLPLLQSYHHHCLQSPLPPALHHLRNIILHKYMQTLLLQQESPIDLSVKQEYHGSTGSQSPRSDVSTDLSNKSTDEEEEYLEVEALDEEEVKEEKMKKSKYVSKRLLPCSTCGKKFDRPSLLERHMRIHTGERPYACDFCNKKFSTSSSLNTHRRIHTGEKPHRCNTCGKCFTASSNLYYHRMTHEKIKPHPCSHCDKTFSTPGDLKKHMKNHQTMLNF